MKPPPGTIAAIAAALAAAPAGAHHVAAPSFAAAGETGASSWLVLAPLLIAVGVGVWRAHRGKD